MEQNSTFIAKEPTEISNSKVSHQWEEVTSLFKPTFCEHCGDMIWLVLLKDKFGIKCKECSLMVHRQCEKKVLTSCITVKHDPEELATQQFEDYLEGVNKFMREIGSHSFYPRNIKIGETKFCNFCRDAIHTVMNDAVACEVCSFILHRKCLRKLGMQSIPSKCKKYFYDDGEEIPIIQQHSWIEGNVQGDCIICRRGLSSITELRGFQCAFCHHAVHNECYTYMPPLCNLGKHSKLIIPPQYVKRVMTDEKKWKFVITGCPEGVTPLLIFINKKSGGQQGVNLLRRFKQLLNPIQVFDLGEGGPAPGLELFKNLSSCLALVCGGDGTVGWYLTAAEKSNVPNIPPAAILPLGTGNDLARSLNWGPGYDGEDLDDLLTQVSKSRHVELDRWSVYVANKLDNGEYEDMKQVHVMNNYFSIGVDAKVTLDFHEQREANPERFKSRVGNKAIYGALGGKAMFETCQLHKEIEVEIDGKKIDIPNDAEGIVVLNLDSYAAGTNLWGSKSDKWKPQSYSDGLLEVLTINSSFHLGAIKAGLSNANRLCQSNDIKITIKKTIASQVDGEPWLQPESIVHIKHLTKSKMLSK